MSTDIIAQVLAGIVFVPILQVIKRYTNLTGVPMAWASFILCLIAGAFVAFATGKVTWDVAVTNPAAFFAKLGEAGGTVFAIATVMYKTIKDRMGLSAKGE